MIELYQTCHRSEQHLQNYFVEICANRQKTVEYLVCMQHIQRICIHFSNQYEYLRQGECNDCRQAHCVARQWRKVYK